MDKLKDLKIAEELNRQLAMPSDCFELKNLPKVRYIVCADEVFSSLLARTIKKNMRAYGFVPKVCVEPKLDLLTKKEIDIEDWYHLASQIDNLELFTDQENPVELKEVLLIASENVAQFISNDFVLKKVNVAILERFMRPEYGCSRTFVQTADKEEFGVMKLKNCDYLVVFEDENTLDDFSIIWQTLMLTYGECGPSGQVRNLLTYNLSGEVKFIGNIWDKDLLKLRAKNIKPMFKTDNFDVLCGMVNHLVSFIDENAAIVVVPQHYSLLFVLAQKNAFPQLNINYVVMRETIEQSSLYKHYDELALHFWAGLVPYWETMAKEAILFPVFGMNKELVKAVKILKDKYLLMQSVKNVKYWQQRLLWQIKVWRGK